PQNSPRVKAAVLEKTRVLEHDDGLHEQWWHVGQAHRLTLLEPSRCQRANPFALAVSVGGHDPNRSDLLPFANAWFDERRPSAVNAPNQERDACNGEHTR